MEKSKTPKSIDRKNKIITNFLPIEKSDSHIKLQIRGPYNSLTEKTIKNNVNEIDKLINL